MEAHSPVLAIIPTPEGQEFAHQLATALGYSNADIIIGSPYEAAQALATRHSSPSYMVVDVGDRGVDVLAEIDALAEYCDRYTRVVVLGVTNDVTFYRELRQRGIIEYFTHPAQIADLRNALMMNGSPAKRSQNSQVITFMSAASGDGSSTLALNTAYALAAEQRQSVVVIDMDFQWGMIARNLDLSTPFGIRDLFEHPDRTIDSTLVTRMLAEYRPGLKVIAAPNDLRMMPVVRPEMIRDLVMALQESYQYIIIDLPHVWTPWVAAALSNATHNVIVAQLWLRSVTHATRLLSVMREIGLQNDRCSAIINRSGAKFKEGIAPKEFERVAAKKVDFLISNDIKTIAAAENQAKTIIEVGNSPIAREISALAQSLHGQLTGKVPVQAAAPERAGPTSWLKRK